MGQDEKTAPGIRGGVRATPPVGTPLGPHAAPVPLPSPPSTSPPRTVGGHTARLITAEVAVPMGGDPPYHPAPPPFAEDDDRLGSGSVPMLSAKPLDLGPPSHTIGGTARLEPVPPEHAAAAKRRIEIEEQQAALLHAPSPPSPSPPAPRPRPPEPQGFELDLSPPPPAPQATSGLALAPNEDAPLSALFAPLSVGVGLVFFAMGSMLTLAIDDHIMASKAVSAVSVIAPLSPTHRTQTASLPTLPSAGPASEHGTGPAPVPSPSAAPVAPPPPSAVTQAAPPTSAAPVRPPPSSGPVKPGGGTRKPALPFP
jgi:hypothetical protein